MDKIITNYINKDTNYINFFRCREINSRTLEIKILNLNNLEYLYRNFINDINNCLRNIETLSFLNIEKNDIKINKLSIEHHGNVLFNIVIIF